MCRSMELQCVAVVAPAWLALGGGRTGCCCGYSPLGMYFDGWLEKLVSAYYKSAVVFWAVVLIFEGSNSSGIS